MLIAALIAKAIEQQGGDAGRTVIPQPTFDPPGGSHKSDTPLTITIETVQTGGTIRYTKTGVDPTISTGTLISSTMGTTTVPANATTELKAITVFSGQVSAVKSATYEITPA